MKAGRSGFADRWGMQGRKHLGEGESVFWFGLFFGLRVD